jgi:hypothetical protein
MEWILQIIDFALHVDVYLTEIIARYGVWTLGVLFVVIFFETGIVVTPFLPGDSLIFAAATFAARGALDPWAIFILPLHCRGCRRHRQLLDWASHRCQGVHRRNQVDQKRVYGAHASLFRKARRQRRSFLARFVPIVRTFAPFVARRQSNVLRILHPLECYRWNNVGRHFYDAGIFLRQHSVRSEEFRTRHHCDHSHLGCAGVRRRLESAQRVTSQSRAIGQI